MLGHWHGHLAIASLLAALVACIAQNAATPRQLSWAEHCAQLPKGPAQSSCSAYANAATIEVRLCAARNWTYAEKSSYYCSGINEKCVAAESRSSFGTRGVTVVCMPALDGTPCQRGRGNCTKGLCVSSSGGIIDANTLPSKPVQVPAQLRGSVSIDDLINPPPPSQDFFFLPFFSLIPRSPLASAKPVAQDRITVTVDVFQDGQEIPSGYLGTSMEWGGVGYYGQNPKTWAKMFTVLGPNQIIRIGGASQEFLTQVPADKEWAAMAALHKEKGVRYLIGLPLNGNRFDLINAIIQKAKSSLPKAAILGFELGNEAQYWECPGLGGWNAQGIWEPGIDPYLAYFDRMARALTNCSSNINAYGEKIVMGPTWDNLNTISPVYTAAVSANSSCYLKEVTFHYYPYYKARDFNPQSVVSESLMREAVRNVTLHISAAQRFGQTVRMSEANSLTGSGVVGTSNSFAAALWTTDLAFEFAAAGVTGINFHWSFGGLPGTGGAPYTAIETMFMPDGRTLPRVRAPWLGYLLFQAAVEPVAAAAANLGPTDADGSPGRLATIISAAATKSCQGGEIKVWPVMHNTKDGGKEIRVVVLHKGETVDCSVTLQLKGMFEDATITWVEPVSTGNGPKGIAALQGTFGGLNYANLEAELKGTPATYSVTATTVNLWSGEEGTGFTFLVPKAKAALLVARSPSYEDEGE